MKKFISFIVCLLIGFVFASVTTLASPARGKPDVNCQVVTFQPFQEQVEFESDVGNVQIIEVKDQTQKLTHTEENRLISLPKKTT